MWLISPDEELWVTTTTRSEAPAARRTDRSPTSTSMRAYSMRALSTLKWPHIISYFFTPEADPLMDIPSEYMVFTSDNNQLNRFMENANIDNYFLFYIKACHERMNGKHFGLYINRLLLY